MNNYDMLDGSEHMNSTGIKAINEQTINRINMQLLNSTEQVENILAMSSPLNRLETYRDALLQNSNQNTAVLQ